MLRHAERRVGRGERGGRRGLLPPPPSLTLPVRLALIGVALWFWRFSKGAAAQTWLMPPRQRRRSKRLSAEDPDKDEPQGGDDHSPELKQSKPRIEPDSNKRGPRRSSREKGGSAEAARNALVDINRGPHCPIFQLSHELLKKIWEYLDSKTKMTTTVRTLLRSHTIRSVAPFSRSHPHRRLPRCSPSASGGNDSAGRLRSSALNLPRKRNPSPRVPWKRYAQPLPMRAAPRVSAWC